MASSCIPNIDNFNNCSVYFRNLLYFKNQLTKILIINEKLPKKNLMDTTSF